MRDVVIDEVLSKDIITQPLIWLAAEHHKFRKFCSLIGQIAASASVMREAMAQTLTFLRADLPLHVLNEEGDLFPMLRLRCAPEDDVDRVIAALSADHGRDVAVVTEIAGLIDEAVRLDRPIPHGSYAQQRLRDFAISQGEHIALEDAVVLPLARASLGPEDLAVLAERMAGRRGLRT